MKTRKALIVIENYCRTFRNHPRDNFLRPTVDCVGYPVEIDEVILASWNIVDQLGCLFERCQIAQHKRLHNVVVITHYFQNVIGQTRRCRAPNLIRLLPRSRLHLVELSRCAAVF